MKTLILPVIQRALVGVEALPPSERADIYEGIQVLLQPHLPLKEECDAACNAAKHLREAERSQLTFSALLARSERAAAQD